MIFGLASFRLFCSACLAQYFESISPLYTLLHKWNEIKIDKIDQLILNVVIIAQRTLKKTVHHNNNAITIHFMFSNPCMIPNPYIHSITHALYSFAHMTMLALLIGQRNRFSIDKKHIEIRFTNVRPIIRWFRLNSFIKPYSSILYFAPFICLH